MKKCATLRYSTSSQAKLTFLSETKVNSSSSSSSIILSSHSPSETENGSASLTTSESNVSQPTVENGSDGIQPRNEPSMNNNM